MFGFFKKIKQAANTQLRANIIRDTYKIAIKDILVQNGVNPAAVDKLPMETLFRLPEATILTILEIYCGVKNQNPFLDDKYVFQSIEEMRSSAVRGSENFPQDNLLDYITYRLELEHGKMSEGHLSKDVLLKIIRFMKSQFSEDIAGHINV